MEVHLRKSPHGAYLQRTSTTTSRHLAAIQSVHAKRNELATFPARATVCFLATSLLFCSTLASPDPNEHASQTRSLEVVALSNCKICQGKKPSRCRPRHIMTRRSGLQRSKQLVLDLEPSRETLSSQSQKRRTRKRGSRLKSRRSP